MQEDVDRWSCGGAINQDDLVRCAYSEAQYIRLSLLECSAAAQAGALQFTSVGSAILYGALEVRWLLILYLTWSLLGTHFNNTISLP
jgi:hypothetical protein